jgi:3-oxoacyl-[acyl-carrier protein] reductase
MRLQNKKALITGASRGIGKAIVDLFIAEGAEVWGLSTKEPEDLKSSVSFINKKLHWISADLGSLSSLESIVETALEEAGEIDILVNNAGIASDNISFTLDIADFQKVIDVNLSAAFLVSRIVAKNMLRSGSGSIINMSSVRGLHGGKGVTNYAASKAGIIGLTKGFALELAGMHIRVNAIAPGFIATGMTCKINEQELEGFKRQIPMKRLGAPEDIAEVALFLASDSSAYITGQVIVVDGGMYM